MSDQEIQAIMDTGFKKVGMTIDDDVKKRITTLSQGLPYFTHMLSLHAAQTSVETGRLITQMDDLRESIRRSLKQAQHSVTSAYEKAIASANKNNLYRQVLTACALADADESGYFYAGDVRPPMSQIMGRAYDIPAFSPHISAFCQDERGPVLKRRGTPKNYQFRFKDPLMQPYVIMRGLDSGLIIDETAFR
jgi:D-ribose pyranose/furanose isomerase RbsD